MLFINRFVIRISGRNFVIGEGVAGTTYLFNIKNF
jgi:hypothetical protein